MSQSKTEVLSPEQKFQQKLFVVRIANAQGTQAAVLRSGTPERTVARWKAAFAACGLEGLREQSKAPRHVANKKDRSGVLSQALQRLAVEEPGLLRVQVLAKLMGEESPDVPSASWISRAKRRLGLTRKRRHRPNLHTKRYEIPEPGYLQVDTKIVEKEGDLGQKLIQFTAIDECTRVRFLSGSLFKSAASACEFIRKTQLFYASIGVKVIRVQTDNGTEFTLPGNEATQASYARGDTDEAQFTQECARLGIKHRLIRARTPQLNGKVERSHRTDEERFYSRFRFATEAALHHALQNVWMPEYNEQRPHTALGGMTPMEFLKKRLEALETEKLNPTYGPDEEKKAA
jgi:hypothetical protein